ncbi:AAA family ATPase [Parafrankia soli]|uniref:AAA family ATPase n=1 Tax=Parafrankia soli TaxID=2599596 RepID=UPI000AF3212E|nr:MoxR family ATPase [Parafrankia soli]
MNEWTTDPGVAAPGAEVRAPAGSGSAASRPAEPSAIEAANDAALLERALFEVKKVIVGQDHMVERMLVALLARGHCLLEGVPGVAKTLAVQTLATVVGGSFVRIQFTSDLVPSDIIGTRIFRSSRETFDIELGPVFANFVLADEINRAPAKVQSALLEVMSERQVSLGGVTHPLPRPFLVLATQNPIESEGVYPLPEAQRDRFLMKVNVPYPTAAEELEIVRRMGVRPPTAEGVLEPESLIRLQNRADDVFVHHAITEYAVRLVLATRSPADVDLPELAGHLAYGASPRASLGLIAAARALALLRGRDYVVPDDVSAVALDVLPHRLVLSYEALAEGLTAEEIAGRVLDALPHPQVAPRQQAGADHGRNGRIPPPVTHSGRWRTDPRTGFPEYFDGGSSR